MKFSLESKNEYCHDSILYTQASPFDYSVSDASKLHGASLGLSNPAHFSHMIFGIFVLSTNAMQCQSEVSRSFR